MGVENEIEIEDVEWADIVLLATGCIAEGLERFEGKKTVEVDVADAIKDPLSVIIQCEKAMEGHEGGK